MPRYIIIIISYFCEKFLSIGNNKYLCTSYYRQQKLVLAKIFNFQCIASGLLGVNGLLVLSPVDVDLDIEVGKRSKLLNMVVRDVTEVIWQESPVL